MWLFIRVIALQLHYSYFHQHMKEWLESAVEKLMEGPVQDESGRRVISALTLAYCLLILDITQPKHKEFLFPVLEMLQLHVDTEKKVCHGYDHLLTVIQPDERY